MHSIETRQKIGDALRRQIAFTCDQCGKASSDKPSSYARKKKHFCSRKCYSAWRRSAPPELQNTWRGGVSNTEAHRRWKQKNPERMAFLKARRYAREKGAAGSHTFEEWNALKERFGNCCATCREGKPLTKDHIIPLSKGGSDDITNIQPLCRNCNSRKWTYIYENPELLQV